MNIIVAKEPKMALANPLLQQLFPAPLTDEVFGAQSMVAALIAVEAAYYDVMNAETLNLGGFQADIEALTLAAARDGVIVPELVRQIKGALAARGEDVSSVHKGMTSQDVTDTANALLFRKLNAHFETKLALIVERLEILSEEFGENPLMARTRMQAALEVRVSDRLLNWQNGVKELQNSFGAVRKQIETVSLGGPVGDGRHWGADLPKIATELAIKLDLYPQEYVWHSLRGRVQDYANWLAKASGLCGKIGQDIALMAQQGVDEIRIAGGGASSAMVHKSNPILAESLVSLGRYNAGLLGTLAQAMLHEQERSGAAWGLEWLTLPQMLATTEASLANLNTLLASAVNIGNEA